VVDQFASLHAIVAADGPAIIRDYYFFNNGIFGHMTAKGNEHAANLIEPALRDWLPEISGPPSRVEAAPQTGNTAQP
jgi:hypothetical protein